MVVLSIGPLWSIVSSLEQSTIETNLMHKAFGQLPYSNCLYVCLAVISNNAGRVSGPQCADTWNVIVSPVADDIAAYKSALIQSLSSLLWA